MIDGIQFKMRKEFDFSFLELIWKVYKVFDDQDSGNVCFGIESKEGKKIVKLLIVF
jgi:serine/threonine-protein kinase